MRAALPVGRRPFDPRIRCTSVAEPTDRSHVSCFASPRRGGFSNCSEEGDGSLERRERTTSITPTTRCLLDHLQIASFTRLLDAEEHGSSFWSTTESEVINNNQGENAAVNGTTYCKIFKPHQTISITCTLAPRFTVQVGPGVVGSVRDPELAFLACKPPATRVTATTTDYKKLCGVLVESL
jgi:hypothetical protein